MSSTLRCSWIVVGLGSLMLSSCASDTPSGDGVEASTNASDTEMPTAPTSGATGGSSSSFSNGGPTTTAPTNTVGVGPATGTSAPAPTPTVPVPSQNPTSPGSEDPTGIAGSGGTAGALGIGGSTDPGSSGASATGDAGSAGEGGTGAMEAGGAGGGTSTQGPQPGEDMPPVYDNENTGLDCPVATTFPAFGELPAIPEFPDPFLLESGDRITRRADWRCRRAEISAQIQQWELGIKPPPTASEVTATYSGNTLTVNVQVGGQSITLTTTITLPGGGSAPYPALIQMDGSGVPASIFTNRGVATMRFTSSALAGQFPTRGQGPFWDLFPDDTAGAYAGWAWGVSRIIDGLQLTADQNQIDTRHLAVTGCSYAGKMALWAGAFDERIALTIPQESGGGGEASWRFMANQPETENLEEAQGTGWYSERLLQFDNADASKLPFDQHSLVAMVAPRAILAIQNTAIDRLGSQAGGASMRGAAEVYEALGVGDRIAFSQAPASGHCQFPSSQTADVEAFVDRFLLGDESVDTSAITKDTYNTDMSQWLPWETPTLE